MSMIEVGFYLYGGGLAVSDIGVGVNGGYLAVKQPGGDCQLYYFYGYTTDTLGGIYLTPVKPIQTAYLPGDLENFTISLSINNAVALTGSALVNLTIFNEKGGAVFQFNDKPVDLRGVATCGFQITAKLKRDNRMGSKPLTEKDYSRYLEYTAGRIFELAMGRGSLWKSGSVKTYQ